MKTPDKKICPCCEANTTDVIEVCKQILGCALPNEIPALGIVVDENGVILEIMAVGGKRWLVKDGMKIARASVK